MTGYEKLSYIENNLTTWGSCANFNGWYSHFANCSVWVNWVAPLITTVIYIYVWPSLNLRIMKWHKKVQKKFKEEQLKAEGEIPVSKEDYEKLMAKHSAMLQEHGEKVARLTSANGDVIAERNAANSELQTAIQTARESKRLLEEEKKQRNQFDTVVESLNDQIETLKKEVNELQTKADGFCIKFAIREFEIRNPSFRLSTSINLQIIKKFSQSVQREATTMDLNIDEKKLLGLNGLVELSPGGIDVPTPIGRELAEDIWCQLETNIAEESEIGPANQSEADRQALRKAASKFPKLPKDASKQSGTANPA